MGLGHLIRCGALAMKLRARGAREILFALPPGAPERRMVSGRGLRVRTLRHNGLLPKSYAYVVDLEAPQERWPFSFASRPVALAVIDDAGLVRDGVDLIVNPNANADPSWYGQGAPLCMGPEYALLRREFETARRRPRKVSNRGRQAVVSLGGSDPGRGTERIMKALSGVDIDIDVIVGPGFLRKVEPARNTVARFRIWRNPARMASRFLSTDLAIVGGGSTLYEIAACGTPAIALSFNRTQHAHAGRLAERGVIAYLGPISELNPERLRSMSRVLLSNHALRRSMSRAGRALVDGRGTDRVATSLFEVIAHPPQNTP